MKTEPLWLLPARRLVGLKETPGPSHATEILQMWRDIKRGGIRDDETPWCAAFVGACLERAGFHSSRFESAKSYLNWGVKLDHPEIGAIAVLTRNGGGHVGFVVGRDGAGNVMLLGGNQDNAVNVRAFSRQRIVGYRWPQGYPLPEAAPLPLLAALGSRSEA